MVTNKQYEKVFMDLMQYTRFRNPKQIKTREDLRDFFGDIQKDRKSKGIKTRLSREFTDAIGGAFLRVRGFSKGNVRSQVLTKKERLERQKMGFVVASVQKSKSGKERIVFRDPKGKFIKDPEKRG